MAAQVRLPFLALALLSATLWAYGSTLEDMVQRWADDPQYSHGYLVPLFSAYLLWSRRKLLDGSQTGSSWWGVVILLLSLSLRAIGVFYFLGFLDAVSLLFCLAALAWTLGGRRWLRWSWPAILFLGFMMPLPYRVQTALGGGLQKIATQMSTYALQTLGVPAVSEGNIILVNDVRIGVVEACNGLGMLVTFFAISTAVAMLLRTGGWWRRAVLIVNAVPVAIVANVVRITLTGMLYASSRNQAANIVFHDVAGWFMMPLAVIVIYLEIYVMDRLIVKRVTNSSGRGPIEFVPKAAVPIPDLVAAKAGKF